MSSSPLSRFVCVKFERTNLRNEGKDAYKPSVYGKKIINYKSSASSYLIKSEDGQVFATLEKKIDQLRDAHFWALVKEAEDRKKASNCKNRT
jgi:hypothetical protein